MVFKLIGTNILKAHQHLGCKCQIKDMKGQVIKSVDELKLCANYLLDSGIFEDVVLLNVLENVIYDNVTGFLGLEFKSELVHLTLL